MSVPIAIAEELDRERPECSRCGTRMMLSRIEPYPVEAPRYERRSFECHACGHSESYVMELSLPPKKNPAPSRGRGSVTARKAAG